jgi:hypothetical protein
MPRVEVDRENKKGGPLVRPSSFMLGVILESCSPQPFSAGQKQIDHDDVHESSSKREGHAKWIADPMRPIIDKF